GEVSIRGLVKPVGGVVAKLEAARLAGARRVIIPKENWQESFRALSDEDFEVIPVERIQDVIALAVPGRAGAAAQTLRSAELPGPAAAAAAPAGRAAAPSATVSS
ncbi:MAG: S16 family serine protease, partial [Limnochordales bacterium]